MHLNSVEKVFRELAISLPVKQKLIYRFKRKNDINVLENAVACTHIKMCANALKNSKKRHTVATDS